MTPDYATEAEALEAFREALRILPIDVARKAMDDYLDEEIGVPDRSGPIPIVVVVPSISTPALAYPDEGGGFWGEVPAIPGCLSQGGTLDELRDNLAEAAGGMLMPPDPDVRSKLPADWDDDGPGAGR